MPDDSHLLPPHRERRGPDRRGQSAPPEKPAQRETRETHAQREPGAKAAKRGPPIGGLEAVQKKQQEEERKDLEQPPKRKNRHKALRALVFTLGALVLLAALGTGFLFWRKHRSTAAEQQRLAKKQSAGPRLLVAQAEVPKPLRTVVLPGEVHAFNEVGVYPKVSGYLKEVRVDKGDHVHRGDLLASVESPETDQQVKAAEVQLRLKKILADRARRLAPSGVISRTDLDNAVEGERTARAQYRQARALQAYEKVIAPYDGTITARSVDPGVLVSATTSLFTIDDPSRLRVWVYVAQDLAPYVKQGDPVLLEEESRPAQPLHAQVTRIADALDPRTRTMLAEVWIDNRANVLSPGTFVRVTLQMEVPPLPVVPSNAILARGDQTLVAVVQGKKLHLAKVQTGLDDGKVTQIRQGLRGGETVALDVPSELGEGAPIQPVTPQQLKEQQQAQARSGPRTPRASSGKGSAQQGGDEGKPNEDRREEDGKSDSAKQPGE